MQGEEDEGFNLEGSEEAGEEGDVRFDGPEFRSPIEAKTQMSASRSIFGKKNNE